MSQPRPTVFLDRDGVLNRRIIDDYVTCIEELDILPGVSAALETLHQFGFRLVVVTNQRGIALGRMSLSDVNAIHNFLNRQTGFKIEDFFICPHDRNSGCSCRKPKPGLLEQADRRFPVLWPASFLIGDSDTDILAAQAKGVHAIKIAGPSLVGADACLADLTAAAAYIIDKNRRNILRRS